MFIAYLHCFWWNKFLKKLNDRGQRTKVGLVLTLFITLWAFSGLLTDEGPLPKICHIFYDKLSELYLPKGNKKIHNSRDASLEFCWDQHFFHGKSAIFSCIKKYSRDCIFIHTLYFFCILIHHFQQQNFITWFKFYCRCGHLINVW